MKLKILQNEYPGDIAWNKFVSSYKASETIISNLPIDQDMLIVLSKKIGILNLESWLYKEIPALDNKSVASLLESNKDATIIIRSLIMRMP